MLGVTQALGFKHAAGAGQALPVDTEQQWAKLVGSRNDEAADGVGDFRTSGVLGP